MQSYGLGIAISLFAHGLLIVLSLQVTTPQQQKLETPNYIQATLVEIEQKAKPKADDNNKKAEQQARKKREAEIKRQKEQERKRAEQQKLQREKEKAKQLALKKVEEEKKRQEKQRQEKEQQEKKRKAEEERRNKEKERQRQKELEDSIAAEKARREAAEKQALNDNIIRANFNGVIRDRVSANWSRPPSARNGMEVTLRIQLVPTGEVIGVDIVTSSGDTAFDRSTVRAVKKAERFSAIKEMENRIFERYYRTFMIKFRPEDLRQ